MRRFTPQKEPIQRLEMKRERIARILSQKVTITIRRPVRKATPKTKFKKRITRFMAIIPSLPIMEAAQRQEDLKAKTQKMVSLVLAITKILEKREKIVQDRVLRMENKAQASRENLKPRVTIKKTIRMVREVRAATAKNLKPRVTIKKIMTEREVRARTHNTTKKITRLVTKTAR